jgi:hypothetical protein
MTNGDKFCEQFQYIFLPKMSSIGIRGQSSIISGSSTTCGPTDWLLPEIILLVDRLWVVGALGPSEGQ